MTLRTASRPLAACAALLWAAVALPAGQDRTSSDAQSELRRHVNSLRRAAMTAPESGSPSPPAATEAETQPAPDGLAESIRRLRSLELPNRRKTSAAATASPATQPATAPIVTTRPSGLSEDDLKQIAGLERGQVASPTDLADALFLAGRPVSAARFYEMALAAAGGGEAGNSASAPADADPEGRAWLLYQIANCRRTADGDAARKTFAALMSEHKDVLWATLGASHDRIVDWMQVNRPHEQIRSVEGALGMKKEAKPSPTQTATRPSP